MSELRRAFDRATNEGRAALVGYLPAGFPSVSAAIGAARAMVEAGADVIEIGWPYSDPLMDGPTIQDAVHHALQQGTRAADVLHTVQEVAATGVATVVMTYWNPVDRYGPARFARDLASAGGVGAITPDLTPEEAGPWLEATAWAGVDPVFLVAPSSTDARIEAVADVTGGFLYAASTMGVTGTRDAVGDHAARLVDRARLHTDLPVGVGLGVSNARQAAEVAAFADGVIVGSAFIRRLLDTGGASGSPGGAKGRTGNADDAGTVAVRDLAAELAAGVRAPARERQPAR